MDKMFHLNASFENLEIGLIKSNRKQNAKLHYSELTKMQ